MVETNSPAEINLSQYGTAMIRVFGPPPMAIDLNFLDVPEQVKTATGPDKGGSFLVSAKVFKYDGKTIELDVPALLIVPGGGEPADNDKEFAGKNYQMWNIPQGTPLSRLDIQSGTLRELLMTLPDLEQFSTGPMTVIEGVDRMFCIPLDLERHIIDNPEVLRPCLEGPEKYSGINVFKLKRRLSPNAAFLIARSNEVAPRMIRAAMTPVARIDDRFDMPEV